MNHDFLIGSSQLYQAHESKNSCGCGNHSNGITRRSFIKRTGAATVATVIAWNGLVIQARAADYELECHHSDHGDTSGGDTSSALQAKLDAMVADFNGTGTVLA